MFNLSQALEAIENKTEFRHAHKDGYSVIDYVVATRESFTGENDFQTMILKNLRGTCFDPEGNISRLGFEKFHNLNECNGWMEKDIDFSAKHNVLEKLDGSCIFSIRSNGSYLLGTRAGVTEFSAMADEFIMNSPIGHRYEDLLVRAMEKNLTAIFEFTSRKNKVVIDYPTDNLTLLAIRCNVTGDYIPYEELASFAPHVPIVKKIINNESSIKDLAEFVYNWDIQSEGIVITFENGFHVKCKNLEYVRKHSSIDLVKKEKSVLKMILENTIDDVLPLVDQHLKNTINLYSESVKRNMDSFVVELMKLFNERNHLEIREFADSVKDLKNHRSFLFKLYNNKDIGIVDFVIKNCSTQTTVESVRHIIGQSFYDIK